MKTKTLPKLKAELQLIFNAYIRLRDESKPCISCGEFKPNMQAGHFFAVGGYDGLRFVEDNVHNECPHDNCFNESHLILYAINLKKRIGDERYELLIERASDYKCNGYKFSRSELIELIEYYQNKIVELKDNM
jgi:hypothetical protein